MDGVNATEPDVASKRSLAVDVIIIDDEPSPPRPKEPRSVIRGSVRAGHSECYLPLLYASSFLLYRSTDELIPHFRKATHRTHSGCSLKFYE
jgi:hypothetical protein